MKKLFIISVLLLVYEVSYSQKKDNVVGIIELNKSQSNTTTKKTKINKQGKYLRRKDDVKGRFRMRWEEYSINLKKDSLVISSKRIEKNASSEFVSNYNIMGVYQLDSNTQLLQAKLLNTNSYEFDAKGKLLYTNSKKGESTAFIAIRYTPKGVLYKKVNNCYNEIDVKKWLADVFGGENNNTKENYSLQNVKHAFSYEFEVYYEDSLYSSWMKLPLLKITNNEQLNHIRDTITSELSKVTNDDSISYQLFAANRISSRQFERMYCRVYKSLTPRILLYQFDFELNNILIDYCLSLGVNPLQSANSIKKYELNRFRQKRYEVVMKELIKQHESISNGGVTGMWVRKSSSNKINTFEVYNDRLKESSYWLTNLPIDRVRLPYNSIYYKFKNELDTPPADSYNSIKAIIFIKNEKGDDIKAMKMPPYNIYLKKNDSSSLLCYNSITKEPEDKGIVISLELFLKYNALKGRIEHHEYEEIKKNLKNEYLKDSPAKKIDMGQSYFSEFDLILMQHLYEKGINPFAERLVY